MAGFGFSLGDLVLFCDYVHSVYKASRQAGEEFKSVTADVKSLQAYLRNLNTELQNDNSIIHRSSFEQRSELNDLIQSCRIDLQDLKKILLKYRSLRSIYPRAIDKIGFTPRKQADIRFKITTHTDRLNRFLSTVHTTTLGRIETRAEANTSTLERIDDRTEQQTSTLGRLVERAEHQGSALGRIEETAERHAAGVDELRSQLAETQNKLVEAQSKLEKLEGIQVKLEKIHDDVLGGRRDPSILTDTERRPTLERELLDDCISEIDVENHHDGISRWLEQVRMRADIQSLSSGSVASDDSSSVGDGARTPRASSPRRCETVQPAAVEEIGSDSDEEEEIEVDTGEADVEIASSLNESTPSTIQGPTGNDSTSIPKIDNSRVANPIVDDANFTHGNQLNPEEPQFTRSSSSSTTSQSLESELPTSFQAESSIVSDFSSESEDDSIQSSKESDPTTPTGERMNDSTPSPALATDLTETEFIQHKVETLTETVSEIAKSTPLADNRVDDIESTSEEESDADFTDTDDESDTAQEDAPSKPLAIDMCSLPIHTTWPYGTLFGPDPDHFFTWQQESPWPTGTEPGPKSKPVRAFTWLQGRRSAPCPNLEVYVPLHITLQEAFAGATKQISLTRMIRDECHQVDRPETTALEVVIVRGVQHGFHIVHKGMGNCSATGPSDLVLVVSEIPHPHFSRSYANLYTKYDIDLDEALYGWSRIITSLDGYVIRVSCTGPTRHYCNQWLPQFGMPMQHHPASHGHLNVQFEVRYPDTLSEEQIDVMYHALSLSTAELEVDVMDVPDGVDLEAFGAGFRAMCEGIRNNPELWMYEFGLKGGAGK